MKIVIDTNIVISDAFFGGIPRKVIDLVIDENVSNVCCDPDDNKFIACAVDAKAIYIVSGDKDLLTVKNYDAIEIVTATEFYERYLSQL